MRSLSSILTFLQPEKDSNKDKSDRELRNAKSCLTDSNTREYKWREIVAKELYQNDSISADELYECIQEEGSQINRGSMKRGLVNMTRLDAVERVSDDPITYSLTTTGTEAVEELYGSEIN